MDLEESAPSRRRRGSELEDALLNAAWQELLERGYAEFTFEGVADRAGTSRPVLYRRWKTRRDLLIAAAKHNALRDPPRMPDTGTLRGDVIELLEHANAHRLQSAAVIAVQLGTYFRETGSAPSELRAEMIGDRGNAMAVLVQRAMERGEIPTRELAPRVVTLPFDLARHEVLMSLKPLSKRTILEIVDEVFLPLVGASPPRASG